MGRFLGTWWVRVPFPLPHHPVTVVTPEPRFGEEDVVVVSSLFGVTPKPKTVGLPKGVHGPLESTKNVVFSPLEDGHWGRGGSSTRESRSLLSPRRLPGHRPPPGVVSVVQSWVYSGSVPQLRISFCGIRGRPRGHVRGSSGDVRRGEGRRFSTLPWSTVRDRGGESGGGTEETLDSGSTTFTVLTIYRYNHDPGELRDWTLSRTDPSLRPPSPTTPCTRHGPRRPPLLSSGRLREVRKRERGPGGRERTHNPPDDL